MSKKSKLTGVHKPLARFIATGMLIILAAGNATYASDEGPKPCVAILEAEVVGKVSASDRKAMAGWLDMLLTESLAKRKDFVTVDRQVLDRVLAEKKIDPKRLEAALKPFYSAGVLICPKISRAKGRKNWIVSVEAVLAQTGQLLAELHELGEWKQGRWTKPPKVSANMGRFWNNVHRNLKRNLNRPVVEVAAGKLTSKLVRLQWRVDELVDSLRAGVGTEHGVVLLTPRHPLSTREERLLRVMGLSAAKRNDKTAGLAPTADMRLSVELVEKVSSKIGFRKTPIKVKLVLRAGTTTVASKTFSGTVGSFEKIQADTGKWFALQLRKTAKTLVLADGEALAHTLAREELSCLRRYVSFGYSETHRCARFVRRALRIAHLDPTCEEAAYFVAMNVGALYRVHRQGDTLACCDRILDEIRKYLDRFGNRNPKHHCRVLNKAISVSRTACWKVRGGQVSFASILKSPNARLYPYARFEVRVLAERGYLAETDKRFAGTNAFSTMGHWLRRDLIPMIPDEYLDEEYKYWRNFWRMKVAKVPGNKADPWELIEAAFQARRKQSGALRKTLQKLADKYPQNQSRIWRFGLERMIPLYLRAAGDSQWRTWKPRFDQKVINIPYPERIAYAKRFCPRFPTVWDYPNLPAIPVRRLVFPKQVLLLGRRMKNRTSNDPRIGPLCLAGGDIWFITPTRWDTINLKVPQYIHILPQEQAFAAGRSNLHVKPKRLNWPKHPRLDLSVEVSGRMNQLTILCVCVTGSGKKQTVWIGTRWHGIARFDKVNGKWAGRWYTRRDGLITDEIRGLTPYKSNGKPNLLVGTCDGRYSKLGLCTLDPQTHSIKVIDRKQIKKKYYPQIGPWSLYITHDLNNDSRRYWRMDDENLWETSIVSYDPPKARHRLIACAPRRGYARGHAPRPIWPSCRAIPASPMDYSYSRNTGPVVDSRRDALWISLNWHPHYYRKNDGLLIFKPAPIGSKKKTKHKWIGPFGMPDKDRITNIWNDGAGHIWVTTPKGVYRVDAETLLASDLAKRNTRTRAQWRKKYMKRLAAANWRCRVRAHVLARRWKNAMKIINAERKSLGPVTTASSATGRANHADLLMWRAMVLANKPGCSKQAIELYEKTISDPLVDRTAKRDARKNILMLLCATGRREEALRRSKQYYRLYPPRRSGTPYGPAPMSLEAMLKKARKKPMKRK